MLDKLMTVMTLEIESNPMICSFKSQIFSDGQYIVIKQFKTIREIQ